MNKIRKALIQEWKTLALLDLEDNKRVAHENVGFEPPDTGIWAHVFFAPNRPDVATLGAIGLDESTGFLQIDLNAPVGSGVGELSEAADKIRCHFPAGRTFEYESQGVIISSSGRTNGRIVDSFYRISVTVAWYARIIRTQPTN